MVCFEICFVRWNCGSDQEIADRMHFIKHSIIERTPVAGPIGHGSRSESIAIKRQDDTASKPQSACLSKSQKVGSTGRRTDQNRSLQVQQFVANTPSNQFHRLRYGGKSRM